MENQAAAVTEHLVQAVEVHLPGQFVFLIGAKIIPAHAPDDVEPFMQCDLVRGIKTESGGIGKSLHR